MNKNSKIALVVGGIIVLIAAFYGGMVYGKAKIPPRGQGGQGGQFAAGNFTGRGGRNGGGFTVGSVIAKDDKSITVQLMGGGSKIIFLDTTTKISKPVDGAIADLTTGTQVAIMGIPNSDGSLNAESIQIRPKMAASTSPVVQ